MELSPFTPDILPKRRPTGNPPVEIGARKNPLPVLCGSVSSWIRENIVNNSSFLGRRSLDLIVKELPLAQCVAFWDKKANRLPTREIIDILSVTGGIPRYLEEINPALSAAENIKRLCFTPNGILRTDFEDMFNDVITHQRSFADRVLRSLVDGPRTISEISASLSTERGGRVTDTINRLVESGFVAADAGKDPETGKDLVRLFASACPKSTLPPATW